MPTPGDLADAFRADGYLVLRGLIRPDELAALQEETLAQIEAGPKREPRGDFGCKRRPGGEEVFYRIQFVTAKELRNDSLLLGIAEPTILAIVAELLGEDWTTYGSALVFKAAGGGPAIELHRDTGSALRFSPEHLFFNVGFYLDAANPATGCLKVLPGSHRLGDVSDLIAAGLENPDLVDVPMEPGDVLIHDSMLLHGSLPTPDAAPLRRTIYYSYQGAGWMLREGVVPGHPTHRGWVAENMRLMQHAIERRAASPRHRGEQPFAYLPPREWCEEVEAACLTTRPISGDLPWERAPEERAPAAAPA
ncbi:MAG TPA: phytanoyl-CoA dioxygenase family protein [Gaiellaceae bacterium]|nr:phytanoyl-CoA dioxygenase family protein [Gaiellaceae bacterium]